ncbi:MAG: hypothetical protein RQ842_05715 [Vulcanisaeta sp.]|nr:hypothetical protein [Vulcanisaeta sp.]
MASSQQGLAEVLRSLTDTLNKRLNPVWVVVEYEGLPIIGPREAAAFLEQALRRLEDASDKALGDSFSINIVLYSRGVLVMARVGGVGVGVFSRDVEFLGLVLHEFRSFVGVLSQVLQGGFSTQGSGNPTPSGG